MMPPIHPVRLISFFILFPLLILGCDLLQQQQPQYQGYRGPAPPPSAAPQPAAVAPLPAQQYNHTKTIRNSVNIDKKSIRLVPLPNEPHKLRITFAFDATEPCM